MTTHLPAGLRSADDAYYRERTPQRRGGTQQANAPRTTAAGAAPSVVKDRADVVPARDAALGQAHQGVQTTIPCTSPMRIAMKAALELAVKQGMCTEEEKALIRVTLAPENA